MIYLASPYSHEESAIQQRRFEQARTVTGWLIAQGKHVFSPIVHCHELTLSHDLPGDASFWHDYNISFLRRSDQIYVLTLEGWKESKGVSQELRYAKMLNIPVTFINERGLTLFGVPK